MEDRFKRPLIELINTVLFSIDNFSDIQGEYVSKRKENEYLKLELTYEDTSQDFHVKFQIWNDIHNIDNIDPGLIVETENFCGQDIKIEALDYMYTKDQSKKLLDLLHKKKTYKYISEAAKWYNRKAAVRRIKDLLSADGIIWKKLDKNVDEDIPRWLSIWSAEYGDVLFEVKNYDSAKYEKFIETAYDEEPDYVDDLIMESLGTSEYELSIKVDNYFSGTIENLSKQELVDIGILKDNTQELKYTDVLCKTDKKSCSEKNHDVEKIKARIKILNFRTADMETIEFDAYFCATCNRYYILQSDYVKLFAKGIPQCEVFDIKAKFGVEEYAEESIYRNHGYRVDEKTGLTARVRHCILDSMIENGVVTKESAISFIEWLIRRSPSNIKMEKAIMKWEEDVRYLRGNKLKGKNIKIRNIFV